MSDEPQPGGPFGFGAFDLSQILRLLQSEGPINLEVARQVAGWVATQGAEEPRIDPADTELMAELTRTAQMYVHQATGLGADLEPRPTTIGRREWTSQTLEHLAPVLSTLAQQLGSSASGDDTAGAAGPGGAGGPGGTTGGEGATPGQTGPGDLSGLMTAMAPLLLGVQAGFMIGHLASRALAKYEMPLPLAERPSVVFVGPNLAAFERDWSLPREELRFYVALHEVLHAALLSVPWVQGRILRLAEEYVSAFEVDSSVVEERLRGVDPTNPASLESALGDPAELLDAIRPPAQEQIRARLRSTIALLEGYADVVMGRIGERMIPEFERIREAGHRHRVERGEATRFLEALLGFGLDRGDYERAADFCRGVVERAGDEGLRQLWEREERIPTPSELEAPGLWLERIALLED